MAPDKELRVRLPADLRERVQQFADRTHRSLTGATIALLEQALDAAEPRSGRGLTGLIPPTDPDPHLRRTGEAPR